MCFVLGLISSGKGSNVLNILLLPIWIEFILIKAFQNYTNLSWPEVSPACILLQKICNSISVLRKCPWIIKHLNSLIGENNVTKGREKEEAFLKQSKILVGKGKCKANPNLKHQKYSKTSLWDLNSLFC